MRYTLEYKNKPLSYLFPNGNGTVKDVIGFSSRNHFIFDDEGAAWDYLDAQHDTLIERKADLAPGLFKKLDHIINNMSVKNRTPYSPVFNEEG